MSTPRPLRISVIPQAVRSEHEATEVCWFWSRRLNIYISTAAALALGRLARHQDLTKRQLLEKLLIEADEAVIASLGDAKLENYLGVTA